MIDFNYTLDVNFIICNILGKIIDVRVDVIDDMFNLFLKVVKKYLELYGYEDE